MIRRTGLFLGCLLTLVSAAPQSVQACGGLIPHIAIEAWEGEIEVPLEGVIVMRGTQQSGAELGEVVVRDGDGNTVPGTATVRALAATQLMADGLDVGFWYGPPTEVTPVLVIWRADASLTAGASYRIEVTDADAGTSDTLDVIAAAAPFAGLSAAPDATFTAEMAQIRASLEASCEDPPGTGPCPGCSYDNAPVLGGVLEATLPAAFTDRYVVHRLVSDSGDAITRRDTAWAADERTAALLFVGESSELCGHLESESLIDGSTATGPSTCVTPSPLLMPDGGLPDAGIADAGIADAGSSFDAGSTSTDAGTTSTDAGTPAGDGGMGDSGMEDGSGGCSVSPGQAPAGGLLTLLAAAAMMMWRRRKHRAR